MLKSHLPVSSNVTFLGNKVIAGINKLKGGHTGLGLDLNPMNGALGRGERFEDTEEYLFQDCLLDSWLVHGSLQSLPPSSYGLPAMCLSQVSVRIMPQLEYKMILS